MATDEVQTGPDYRAIFDSLPGCYLILLPDAPRFTIVAVNDAYARATHTSQALVGMGLFEAFPDNPNDPEADGVRMLTESLQRVLDRKTIDYMKIQKYDIPTRGTGGGFEVRYWNPDNSPVLDADGRIRYIIHHVIDVTDQEKLIRMYGSGEETDAALAGHRNQTDRLEKLLVSRELKMVELKKEIQDLKGQLGRA
jgi:PAS domain-containing protein